jgi:superfamily II DNA/RNA helicase
MGLAYSQQHLAAIMPGQPDALPLLMSSAVELQEIQRLASDFMHNYIFLAVGRVGSSTDLIMQHVEFVQGNDKRQVLLDLINTVEVRPLCKQSALHRLHTLLASMLCPDRIWPHLWPMCVFMLLTPLASASPTAAVLPI